jgi:hypothetical protein
MTETGKVKKCKHCGMQIEEAQFNALVGVLGGGTSADCDEADEHDWKPVKVEGPEIEPPF